MITAIIQARMGSTRLPGKTLANVAGKPLLKHLLNRVEHIKGIEQVVIATTYQPHDQILLDFAKAEGLPACQGSETDVLDRFYQAAKLFDANVIVRVTPDCPLLDPGVSERVLNKFLEGEIDYASTVMPPTFPDGLDTEVFSFATLERVWTEAKRASEREHMMSYIWHNPELFRVANVANDEDLSHMRWTVDEASDFAFVEAILARLAPGDFSMRSVLALLEKEPELQHINAGIARNEGYAKSVKEDQLR